MNKKEELAAMINCLRQAKKLLWDGSQKDYALKPALICYAISRVPTSVDQPWSIQANVKRAIHNGLGGCYTFNTWLIRQLGTRYYRLSSKRIQQLRHEWVDQIIRDWTKQLEAMP